MWMSYWPNYDEQFQVGLLLEYEAGSELYTLSEERNLLQNGRFNWTDIM